MAPLDGVVKRFDSPDEIRSFSKGRFEVVRIGEFTIGRATYEPGWKWSEHVGPYVNATRCVVEHVGLVVAGAAVASFDDGRIMRLNAGDLFYIPPIPHDSWVLGNEPYVSLHFLGAERYAAGKDNSGQIEVERDAHCFVCGWANSASLGVSFQPDGDGGSRTTYLATPEHDGWPGFLHGGVLFALLDDAVGWAARYQGQPCVTARAEIRYRRPVLTYTVLDIAGRIRTRGRAVSATAKALRRDTGESVADFEATLFPRPVARRID